MGKKKERRKKESNVGINVRRSVCVLRAGCAPCRYNTAIVAGLIVMIASLSGIGVDQRVLALCVLISWYAACNTLVLLAPRFYVLFVDGDEAATNSVMADTFQLSNQHAHAHAHVHVHPRRSAATVTVASVPVAVAWGDSSDVSAAGASASELETAPVEQKMSGMET